MVCFQGLVTLHVSVWVEIDWIVKICKPKLSRSTWACELKWQCKRCAVKCLSHAPRERVSWNFRVATFLTIILVTLHVSVWVEIKINICKICKYSSRSTWACELKCQVFRCFCQTHSHAPRERVSWNFFKSRFSVFVWVTLHVSVWVEIIFIYSAVKLSIVTLHVSVWVEIFQTMYALLRRFVTLHVSVWVEISLFAFIFFLLSVTLHVSVWVEIVDDNNLRQYNEVTLHVSVWVEIYQCCDLVNDYMVTLHVSVWVEIGIVYSVAYRFTSHAPRERVSWNFKDFIRESYFVRSRSTWACELKFVKICKYGWGIPSRSTWACELKY